MRRFLVLVLFAAAVLVPGSRGSTVLAQQVDRASSPAEQLLSGYFVFPDRSLPSGLKAQAPVPLDNVHVAALTSNPTDIAKILARARLDGLEEDFLQSSAGSAQMFVQIALYRDSSGADADVADPNLLAALPPSPVAVPSFADVSAGYSLGSGQLEENLIIFAAGRVEARVGEVGPAGTTKLDDVLPLARLMESQLAVPPPPPSGDELAVLQTQTSPESILRDAFTLLHANYLQELPPSQLLDAAYRGAGKALGDAGVSGLPAAPDIAPSDAGTAWAAFLPAYQALERMAPGSLSPQDLAYDSATEMYSNLNCHTGFFKPSLYARVIASLQGAGESRIGIQLLKLPDGTYAILRVEQNSPAELAGLQPGDIILAIDQQTPLQAGSHFDDLFTGPSGSPITLTIQRSGSNAPFDTTIVRSLIPSVIVQHQVLPGGIGYIELDAFPFGDQAVDDVAAALQDFQSQGDVEHLVLDLRYNAGGSEQTLGRIAGLFVQPDSLLVTQTEQDGTIDVVRSAGATPPAQQSMAVLIGQGTASSAEMFAQSLKDLGRATLVGETTAGCVNGGQTLGLLDGSGVFVSTIDVRSGPKRVALENVGVTPDVAVQLTLPDVQQHADPVLQAAAALLTSSSPQPNDSGEPARDSR